MEADATAIRKANDASWHAYERKKADQLTSDECLAYTKAHDHWQQQSVLLEQEYQSATATWRAARQKFEAVEEKERSAVIESRNRYLASDRQAVEAVIQLTLEKSPYPQSFPRNIEVHYNPENRIVLLNFQLPDFQRVAILTHDRKLGERQRTQAQETALYSIAIRTLYEAISSDEINAIDSVVFNGWVDYVDGATGQARQAYILLSTPRNHKSQNSTSPTSIRSNASDLSRASQLPAFPPTPLSHLYSPSTKKMTA